MKAFPVWIRIKYNQNILILLWQRDGKVTAVSWGGCYLMNMSSKHLISHAQSA